MATTPLYVIVGLGASGLSCARYLNARGLPIAITDTRVEPPNLAALHAINPTIPVALGGLNADLLASATHLIVSPGIALREPLIAAQIKQGKPAWGDIELFAQAVKAPVIAITGTNAKSTVTTLVGAMAVAAGYRCQVGGNLGVPALDMLAASATDLFVLELSSFQLETTYSLQPRVATILNITPDHMDRYDTLTSYQQAKQRVYRHAEIAVCNRDDALTTCQEKSVERHCYFSAEKPKGDEFGLINSNKKTYLAFADEPLLAVDEMLMTGKHSHSNALAALAIGHSFGLPFDAMLGVLREFRGLPHRCQLVREISGVKWINDSKGTNVGATEAAIEGMGSHLNGKLILIAGGVGKNADFRPLLATMEKYVRHVVLIGEEATALAQLISDRLPISMASSMEEAVQQAAAAAHVNDCVLLSPACASFDMFKDYAHRGDVFMRIVQAM